MVDSGFEEQNKVSGLYKIMLEMENWINKASKDKCSLGSLYIKDCDL